MFEQWKSSAGRLAGYGEVWPNKRLSVKPRWLLESRLNRHDARDF